MVFISAEHWIIVYVAVQSCFQPLPINHKTINNRQMQVQRNDVPFDGEQDIWVRNGRYIITT